MTKERRRKDENESLRYEKGCRHTKDESTKRRKNENEKTKTNRFATKKADALRKTKSKMKIRLTNHSPAHQYRSRFTN